MNRTERLLDLLALLLASPSPLTFRQAAETLPPWAYGGGGWPHNSLGERASRRTYLRDRAALSLLGHFCFGAKSKCSDGAHLASSSHPREAMEFIPLAADAALFGASSVQSALNAPALSHFRPLLILTRAKLLSAAARETGWKTLAAQMPRILTRQRSDFLQPHPAGNVPQGTPPMLQAAVLPGLVPLSRSLIQTSRILALVSCLTHAPPLALTDLSLLFETSVRQLRRDISLLTLIGLPPYSPSELIEVEVVRGKVLLRNQEVLPIPLALSHIEKEVLALAVREALSPARNEEESAQKPRSLRMAS